MIRYTPRTPRDRQQFERAARTSRRYRCEFLRWSPRSRCSRREFERDADALGRDRSGSRYPRGSGVGSGVYWSRRARSCFATVVSPVVSTVSSFVTAISCFVTAVSSFRAAYGSFWTEENWLCTEESSRGTTGCSLAAQCVAAGVRANALETRVIFPTRQAIGTVLGLVRGCTPAIASLPNESDPANRTFDERWRTFGVLDFLYILIAKKTVRVNRQFLPGTPRSGVERRE